MNAKAVEGSALEAIQGTETFSAEPAGWDLDYGGDGSQRAMAFLIAQVTAAAPFGFSSGTKALFSTASKRSQP